jgi:hypothetical protein
MFDSVRGNILTRRIGIACCRVSAPPGFPR